MSNYSKLLGQALFIIFLIQITIQQQYSLSSYGSNQEVGLASDEGLEKNGKNNFLSSGTHFSTKMTVNTVRFLEKINQALNQESSNEHLNNITDAFENTFNSLGWISLDSAANTFGSWADVYSTIGDAIKMVEESERRKKKRSKEIEETKKVETNKANYYSDLKVILGRALSNLLLLKQRIRVLFPNCRKYTSQPDVSDGINCSTF